MNAMRPSTKDELLRKLLKAWRVVATLPSRFQERVWRRIWCAEWANTKDQAEKQRSPDSRPGVRLHLDGRKAENAHYKEKQYIQLRHVADTAVQINLKKGDATARVCSQCETVSFQTLLSPRGGN